MCIEGGNEMAKRMTVTELRTALHTAAQRDDIPKWLRLTEFQDGEGGLSFLVIGPQKSKGRNVETECEWCGEKVQAKNKGPIPRFCGGACRMKDFRSRNPRSAFHGRARCRVCGKEFEVDHTLLLPEHSNDWAVTCTGMAMRGEKV